MKTIDPDRLSALGIAPGVKLVLEGESRPADDQVALGLSSAPVARLEPSVAMRRFVESTKVHAFVQSALRMGADEATVRRSDETPGLFLFNPEGLDVDADEAAQKLDDVWLVDSRDREVLLHARGPSGECLLRFEGAMIDWFNLAASPSEAMRALDGWAPAALPEVAAPSPTEILGGFDAPAWLLAPLNAAASLDAFAVCAAASTLGRLWSPLGTSVAPSLALERARRGDDPLGRAIQWFQTLAPEVHAAVARLACVEADLLAEQLDALSELASGDLVRARAEACAWLERRDDLAGVLVMLRACGAHGDFAMALDALDRRGRLAATMWNHLAPLTSDRLRAVAWQFPNAWWASLA